MKRLRSRRPAPRVPAFAVAICCAAVLPAAARADVKPALPFTDHMVLQRGADVPVWGTADPGENVTVDFAGQTKAAAADGEGRWSVKLSPLEASAEGRTLTVRGKNVVSLADVLVGEVWLCSGQSNMEASLQRLLKSAAGPKLRATTDEIVNRELATTTPGIRLLKMSAPKRGAAKAASRWEQCGPEALKNANGEQGFSAVGYFFARELHDELKVPIGAIEAAVGGTRIETWTPPEGYAAVPAFAKEALAAKEAKEAKDAAASPLTIDGVSPGKNFRVMVQPLAPFALRGVIWYQGETNLIDRGEGPRYADKMEALIQSWRALWKQPELPFYYVQLPRHLYAKRKPGVLTSESLPYFREGQSLALRVAHTGMAVTTDLVDTPGDIHPPDKWDVGHRLALLALAQTYGRHDVAFSGPVFQSSAVRDGKVVLTFAHVGKGLVSKDDQPLRDFLVAGADRHFVPADAAIEGDTVVVSSPAVPQPAAVRFCWRELDVPNLFNRDGLPAAPFRTDDWPVAAGPATRPEAP